MAVIAPNTISRHIAAPDLSLTLAIRALVGAILLTSSLVDVSTTIHIGPTSLQGVLSIAYFISGIILLAFIPGAPWSALAPVTAFAGFAGLSLIWTQTVTNGLQNAISICTFALMLHLGMRASASDPTFIFWLNKRVKWAVGISTMTYLASVAVWGVDNNEIISARAFGMFALIGVAQQLARWRFGSIKGLLLAVAITAVIGLSQSRLALGVAIALFPLAQLPGRKLRLRKILMGIVTLAIVIAASYGALWYFDSLRDRFLTGDVSIKIGDLVINGSGRARFWKVTIDAIQESPVFGKGAGSTEGLIEGTIGQIRHPHNDYLRILYDYGYFGLALWIVGLGALIVGLWRRFQISETGQRNISRLQYAAMLTTIAFALVLTADNALVYLFMVAPIGLISGTAIGYREDLR